MYRNLAAHSERDDDEGGEGLESRLNTRGTGNIGKEEMESGRAKKGKGSRAEDERGGLLSVHVQ